MLLLNNHGCSQENKKNKIKNKIKRNKERKSGF